MGTGPVVGRWVTDDEYVVEIVEHFGGLQEGAQGFSRGISQ